MKVSLLLYCIIATVLVIAQPIDFVYRDSTVTNRSFQITSLNTFATNSLNNAFLNKFIYGGAISTDLLEDNQQKKFNVLGGEAEQTISYFEGSLFKSLPNLGLTVSFTDQNFASANYKPDLFNLIFKGNSDYLGDTLDFSYAHGQYLHFQNYGIGLYDKRTQSYIRLGFLVGNRSINYHTGQTYFHTSEDAGDVYLKTDLFGPSTVTDSTSSYFTAAGYGLALELNHNFLINSKSGNKHIVNFNLSNIGSIFWNNKTQLVKVDTAYQYSGFDYTQIESVENLDAELLQDTLGVYIANASRRESLPIQIIINKIPVYSLTQKWQSTFGLKAILIPDYRPMVFGGVYYQPNQFFSVSTRAIFGGFGGLRFGLSANLWVKNNFHFSIGTLDMIGLVSEKMGKGKSVNFGLQLNF